MAISHKDHDHPNTPQARAACRKAMASGDMTLNLRTGDIKPAQMTVVPRRRGDGGVVKGLKATEPKAATRRLKVSGTLIKAIGDLADVPQELARAVRQAWTWGWTVQAGHPFNDDERRIVVSGEFAEVALVWDSTGRTGTFVRNWDSSVTFRMDDFEAAFTAAANADQWDEFGNLKR